MKTLLFVISGLLVVSSAMAEKAAKLETSFKSTSTHQSRILTLGTAELVMTGGGFGNITFKSKDGKIKTMRPLYPRGHEMNADERNELLQYVWPDDWSFREFIMLKMNEIEESQP
jgi:hypothetical protein